MNDFDETEFWKERANRMEAERDALLGAPAQRKKAKDIESGDFIGNLHLMVTYITVLSHHCIFTMTGGHTLTLGLDYEIDTYRTPKSEAFTRSVKASQEWAGDLIDIPNGSVATIEVQ